MSSQYNEYKINLPSETGWVEPLINQLESTISQGKDVVLILIARKMARLWDYYIAKFERLGKYIDKNKDKIRIITEHAIPSELQDVSDRNTGIIIIDDLIVYGDTVETVSENVFYLTGIRPEIVAMAASKEAKLQSLWCNVIYPKYGQDDDAIIDRESIPAYTARNSWNILGLKRPIDLEHTIFEIPLDEKQYEYANLNLESILRHEFRQAQVYSVIHTLPKKTGLKKDKTLSVTVLFDQIESRIRNKDFNKLRFFLSDQKLSVISFAPNIWNELDLVDPTIRIFSNPHLNSAWRKISDRISQFGIPEHQNIEPILVNMLRRNLTARCSLSSVVWANYLKSLENALRYKDNILQALSNIFGRSEKSRDDLKLELSGSELSLLVGPYLSNEVGSDLARSIDDSELNLSVSYRSIERDDMPLIPKDEMDEYLSQKITDIHFAPTLGSALSIIFYRLWKKYGLINYPRREERVQVGETIDSLYQSFSVIYKDKNLMAEISRWIDSRIDMGIVVPKYEYQLNSQGNRIWRRYFRAGEREDILVDIASVATKISGEIYGDGEIEIDDFADYVISALIDISRESGGQLILSDFMDSIPRIKMDGWGNPPSDLKDDLNFHFVVWIYMIVLGAFRQSIGSEWNVASIAYIDDADSETGWKNPVVSGNPLY